MLPLRSDDTLNNETHIARESFDRRRGEVRRETRTLGIYNVQPRGKKAQRTIHDLSDAERAAFVQFCSKHLAISPMAARELDVDWFSRKGLKPRWKPRAHIRIARAAAQRAAASFSMKPK